VYFRVYRKQNRTLEYTVRARTKRIERFDVVFYYYRTHPEYGKRIGNSSLVFWFYLTVYVLSVLCVLYYMSEDILSTTRIFLRFYSEKLQIAL